MVKTKTIVRAAAWLVFVAVVFVTLGSPQYRPTTELAHDVEHALAFAVLGLLFGLGYAGNRLSILLGAVPVIGLLEILQLWMPGRHARVEDFVVNLITFWVAFAAVCLALAVVTSRRGKADQA
ncbi:MAG: VanZ family protein [Xanthobacteraceae bacterium]